jgi:hypothetical protein
MMASKRHAQTAAKVARRHGLDSRVNALLMEHEVGNIERREVSLRWYDPSMGCTVVMATPGAEPRLWREYLGGARRSYRKFGVEDALELDSIRDGNCTAMFFAILDGSGRMIGGVRAKGPLECAEDSHALVEWAGQPGQAAVRKMINDRVPFGILEMKAAWVCDQYKDSASVAKALARTGFWAMALLDVQFCMATAAAYVLERWKSSGGVVAPIPAAPYPTETYHTKMMWWDRRTFANHGEPDQVAKILAEMSNVTRLAYDSGVQSPALETAL